MGTMPLLEKAPCRRWRRRHAAAGGGSHRSAMMAAFYTEEAMRRDLMLMEAILGQLLQSPDPQMSASGTVISATGKAMSNRLACNATTRAAARPSAAPP